MDSGNRSGDLVFKIQREEHCEVKFNLGQTSKVVSTISTTFTTTNQVVAAVPLSVRLPAQATPQDQLNLNRVQRRLSLPSALNHATSLDNNHATIHHSSSLTTNLPKPNYLQQSRLSLMPNGLNLGAESSNAGAARNVNQRTLFEPSNVRPARRVNQLSLFESSNTRPVRLNQQRTLLVESSNAGPARRVNTCRLFGSSNAGSARRVNQQCTLYDSSNVGSARRMNQQRGESSNVGPVRRVNQRALRASSHDRPARPINPHLRDDPAWSYAKRTYTSEGVAIKCLLCGKTTGSGITRMRQHLACLGTDIVPCLETTSAIKREIVEFIEWKQSYLAQIRSARRNQE